MKPMLRLKVVSEATIHTRKSVVERCLNIVEICVDEKVFQKYVYCCLNNENCCLNNSTKQILIALKL